MRPVGKAACILALLVCLLSGCQSGEDILPAVLQNPSDVWEADGPLADCVWRQAFLRLGAETESTACSPLGDAIQRAYFDGESARTGYAASQLLADAAACLQTDALSELTLTVSERGVTADLRAEWRYPVEQGVIRPDLFSYRSAEYLYAPYGDGAVPCLLQGASYYAGERVRAARIPLGNAGGHSRYDLTIFCPAAGYSAQEAASWLADGGYAEVLAGLDGLGCAIYPALQLEGDVPFCLDGEGLNLGLAFTEPVYNEQDFSRLEAWRDAPNGVYPAGVCFLVVSEATCNLPLLAAVCIPS